MDGNWRIPTILDIQLIAGKDGRKNPVFYQVAKNFDYSSGTIEGRLGDAN